MRRRVTSPAAPSTPQAAASDPVPNTAAPAAGGGTEPLECPPDLASASPSFPDPIPGVIPFGTLTLFAGAPGVGKTAMLADWIVRWRDGRRIWGHTTNAPTQFCYLAADRHWASHQQWFNAVGFPDILRYSLVDDPEFNPKDLNNNGFNAFELFVRALNQAANGYPPIPGAHVFVDPVSPLFIAGSANQSRDVARTLLQMSREAQFRRINLTLVAHFGKQLTDKQSRYARPQDRIAGSGAFSGFSDTQIWLVDPEPPDHPFHCLGWNPRHAPPEEFPCTRDENGLFIPYDIMKEDEVAAQIVDCFAETGATSLAVIRERAFDLHGYSPSTVRRALERLLEQGRIAKVKHGVYSRVRLH